MKKNLIIFLNVLTMMLVGCGNSNQEGSNTNDNILNTTTQEEVSKSEVTQNETSTSVDLNAIVDEITSKIEWASLDTVEDDALISEFFTLDTNNPNYKQLLIKQCPMSAVIAEIILVQTNDINSTMEDLEVRKQKLINTDAYYPEHKRIAEESIVGNYDDIVYFIACDSAKDSEKILIEYLDSLK
ncbi:MAG: hypothetical protein ACI4WH_02795 [Oscillospiraceae bacterium]